ncbi:hypothetical protein MHH56_02990 [Paenibacillus sp. FSL K6-3182]|uniref:hypothetical protein n=1 Tax=unclassified Paenibacillus TaxID=185978 RepID=UPI0030D4E608
MLGKLSIGGWQALLCKTGLMLMKRVLLSKNWINVYEEGFAEQSKAYEYEESFAMQNKAHAYEESYAAQN